MRARAARCPRRRAFRQIGGNVIVFSPHSLRNLQSSSFISCYGSCVDSGAVPPLSRVRWSFVLYGLTSTPLVAATFPPSVVRLRSSWWSQCVSAGRQRQLQRCHPRRPDNRTDDWGESHCHRSSNILSSYYSVNACNKQHCHQGSIRNFCESKFQPTSTME